MSSMTLTPPVGILAPGAAGGFDGTQESHRRLWRGVLKDDSPHLLLACASVGLFVLIMIIVGAAFYFVHGETILLWGALWTGGILGSILLLLSSLALAENLQLLRDTLGFSPAKWPVWTLQEKPVDKVAQTYFRWRLLFLTPEAREVALVLSEDSPSTFQDLCEAARKLT